MAKDTREKISIRPMYKKIIVSYAFLKGISKTEAYNLAIRGLFDDIPKIPEKELLDIYNKLTPEERKYPHK